MKNKLSDILKSNYALLFFAGILIIIGALELPYVYYTLLRIFVPIAAIFTFLLGHEMGLYSKVYVVFIAILFNPIIPVHLNKETWIVLDLIFGSGVSIMALYNYCKQ